MLNTWVISIILILSAVTWVLIRDDFQSGLSFLKYCLGVGFLLIFVFSRSVLNGLVRNLGTKGQSVKAEELSRAKRFLFFAVILIAIIGTAAFLVKET